ncbi:hypothetical protein MKX03_037930 [Papaver bracteatum]|nr:hypothetical protein MKX03_037930 [Papaver bracteatum]
MGEEAAQIVCLIRKIAEGGKKTIVFTNTKIKANELVGLMKQRNCRALFEGGNDRKQTLSDFRGGLFNTLIASDIAASGLDVPQVDLVIHYHPPVTVEHFVLRTNRAGRAKATGIAFLVHLKEHIDQVEEIKDALRITFIEVTNLFTQLLFQAGHNFPTIFYLAVGGLLLSYIYSAPPLKNGWIGNFALGASYISLPWWAGQALFGTLTPDIIVLTILYSTAGLGIAIINDFKSIEGDRAMGLQSLPVAFGVDAAKWICVGAIDITQLSVAGYLLYAGKLYYALALLGLIIPQVVFQFQYFLKDPIKYDVKYQASAQPFLVLGLLVTALATSH